MTMQNQGVDLATFKELLTPAGQDLLREIGQDAPTESPLALGTRLRENHPADLVATAMTQYELRLKAGSKFGVDAAKMYFTPDALEQATRAGVSHYRASRLAQSGPSSVVDVGCSIGSDLIAFARAGLRSRGIDTDPVRVAIARANLEALELEADVTVTVAEATSLVPAPGEAVFVDPARRSERGRVFSLHEMSPPWSWASRLLQGPAVIKTMPGIGHDAIPDHVEAEWISEFGDLVEACLWGAPFATTPRRATLLPRRDTLVTADLSAPLGYHRQFLVEPDDAVIRAGLVAELAAKIGGVLLDPHIAYVTTDHQPQPGFGRWYRIIEQLPYQAKQLRHALVAREIGPLTVKKRGIQVVPEHLIAYMRLTGKIPATLVISRTPRGAEVYLVEPLQL